MLSTEGTRDTIAAELGPNDQLNMLEVAREMVRQGFTGTDPLEPHERAQFERDFARVAEVHPTDAHVYVVFENTQAWLIPKELEITAYKPN